MKYKTQIQPALYFIGFSLIAVITAQAQERCTFGPITITANQTSICPNDSASVCAPAGYVTYSWNSGQNTPCINTSFAGNYYVTVTDTNGCTATSNHVVINVYPPMVVSVSISGDTLEAFSGVAFQWYWDDTLIPGATSAIYIAPQNGLYTVVVTDINGCIDHSVPIQVMLPLPTVTIEMLRPSCVDSSNGAAVAIATGDGPFTYQWSAPDQYSDTATGLQAGTLAVTVTDIHGQFASGEGAVEVDYLEANVTTALHCNTTNDTVFGGVVPHDGGIGNLTYALSNGDTGRIITSLDTGTYTYTVRDAYSCSASVPIVIEDYPPLIIQVVPTVSTDNNGTDVVQITSGAAPFIYNWSNGDSTDTIFSLQPGIYSVTVTDLPGCSVVATDTVVANIPGCCGPEPGFMLFPNPSDGNQFLFLPGNGYQEVKIYTTAGQLLFKQWLNESDRNKMLSLNLSYAASGIYMLQVIGQEGTLVRELVIEK